MVVCRRSLRAVVACAVVFAGALTSLTSPASAADVAPGAIPHVPVTGIPCYESDGPRVSVFYLYADGQPDDLADRLPVILDAAAQVDAVFQASAARTGGVRHVRFRTSGCSLVVKSLAVASPDVTANLALLKQSGLLPSGDTGLAFVSPTLGAFAGDATRPVDDRGGAVNLSNSGGQLAAVGYSFWGSVEGATSMLARSLGAVQAGAPHASAGGGCTDGPDPLCYDDLTIPGPVTQACGPAGRYLLDCGHDDYFSTAPVPGSWLASQWNVADSVFLTSEQPPQTQPVEALSVVVDGIPADGRVGPQTPLTVRVTNSHPLDRAALVSDRSPGVQPLAVSGSTATGSLRGLTSAGQGILFALATDRLGRERLSPVISVRYVGGAVLAIGSPSASLHGVVPYTVHLDLSGDQQAATRLLVARSGVQGEQAVVLADRAITSGTTEYTGTIDTTVLPDGIGQQLVLVLLDAAGNAIPGSQTALRRSVTNKRPSLALDVAPDAVLPSPTTLTATVGGPVTSVRYLQTTSDCASGRVLGEATAAPYAVSYEPAVDWKGPEHEWALCATAVLADGTSTTVGPVPVSTTQPDSVELRVEPGTRLTVGLNRLPVVVRDRSHRRLRAVQLFEGATVFGKPGHLVLSQAVSEGALPATVDLLVPPGAIGRTELYVRAVFADGAGEYIRSAAVSVEGVVGPAPAMRLSASTIAAGGRVLVSGTAPAGAQLRLYGVSRPSTTYTLLRYGAVPADGRFSAMLSPRTNMRIYAEIVGGGKTAALPLEVRSAVSFGVTRTGAMVYKFAGSVRPARANMTVTVARRTATGAVALVRTRTAADGAWSVAFRFPVRGTFDLIAVASADAINAQGVSMMRRLAVS